MAFGWCLHIGFAVKAGIATHYVRYDDPNHSFSKIFYSKKCKFSKFKIEDLPWRGSLQQHRKENRKPGNL